MRSDLALWARLRCTPPILANKRFFLWNTLPKVFLFQSTSVFAKLFLLHSKSFPLSHLASMKAWKLGWVGHVILNMKLFSRVYVWRSWVFTRRGEWSDPIIGRCSTSALGKRSFHSTFPSAWSRCAPLKLVSLMPLIQVKMDPTNPKSINPSLAIHELKFAHLEWLKPSLLLTSSRHVTELKSPTESQGVCRSGLGAVKSDHSFLLRCWSGFHTLVI